MTFLMTGQSPPTIYRIINDDFSVFLTETIKFPFFFVEIRQNYTVLGLYSSLRFKIIGRPAWPIANLVTGHKLYQLLHTIDSNLNFPRFRDWNFMLGNSKFQNKSFKKSFTIHGQFQPVKDLH